MAQKLEWEPKISTEEKKNQVGKNEKYGIQSQGGLFYVFNNKWIIILMNISHIALGISILFLGFPR